MRSSPHFFSRAALVAAVCLASLPGRSQAQSATTDPVGFITLNVAGTTGGSENVLSLNALGLTRPVEYQGRAETVTATTIQDNDSIWVDDQYNDDPTSPYCIEITSGPKTGVVFDIVDTNASNHTLTIAATGGSDLSGVTAPVSFRVRKHWTLASIFGAANEAGLHAGNASHADHVLIYAGGAYETYYYSNATVGLITTGWRKIGGGNSNQANTIIYPDEGLLVNRFQTGNVSTILLGAVKVGATSVPVFSGLNIVSNVYAASMTLGSSNLFTSNAATGLSSGTATTADTVLLRTPTGYDTYFYNSTTSGLLTPGWRKVGAGNADQSTTQIPVGASIIINRVGSAFNWVVPQHPTTL